MIIPRAIVAIVALSFSAYALPAGNNSDVFEIDERATLATVYTTCVTVSHAYLDLTRTLSLTIHASNRRIKSL